ncbi:hypothetical protein C8R45DRAFT_1021137 [Mycena sanguinolenta]|nr:hypothetical protein C8R45DRAFT_1021137 [Mycena sanguinolenta]
MVETRASIYYLSSFAQFLQPKETELHQEETRDASATKKVRVVNHLSTLFSRGRAADEEIRVVAVAASVLRDELEVYVTTSAVAAQTESSDQSNKTLLLSRNSGSEKDGNWTLKTIPAGEDYDTVLRLTQNTKLPFSDFVHISVRLLRAGGARIIAQPANRDSIHQEVAIFFVRSCLSKIKARFAALRMTYGELASLKGWTPLPGDSVEPAQPVISHRWVRSFLEDAKIQDTAGNFQFDTGNAPLWWGCLVDMLVEMGSVISNKDPTVVSAFLEATHYFLSVIPSDLWRMEGLIGHLRRCRLLKQPKFEDEDTQDESTADALPAGDDSLPEETRAFFRGVDAVCAWTTGARYLLRSQLAKSTAPLVISLVDFPRGDIKESTPEALINRWRSVASEPWPDETLPSIKDRLVKFQKTMPGMDSVANVADSAATAAGPDPVAEVADPTIGTRKGACHCEAGLIASIYLRQKDLLKDLPPGKGEPPAVANAFANFSAKTRDSFTVGVAKKCCPTCKILIDILRGHELDLHISGAHSRFHPWVPPQWLPDDIIEELEKRLVKVVSELLVNPSRASSPTSGSDDSGHFNFSAEELERMRPRMSRDNR